MKHWYLRLFSVSLCVFLLNVPSLLGNIVLPKLISDGIVLQRETALTIWGWADEGEAIVLSFNENSYNTTADADGKWQISLPAMDAGGPFEMVLKGNNTVNVKDILIGDVWLCSGQSNMELPLYRVAPLYPDVFSAGADNALRYFHVPDRYDFNVQHDDLEAGEWLIAEEATLPQFSALAYFYGSALRAQYNVPVGLINSSLGGSPADAWMSARALKEYPEKLKTAARFSDSLTIALIEAKDKAIHTLWHTTINQNDQGKQHIPWYDNNIDDNDWNDFTLPGYWSLDTASAINGVVWFRKSFEVPDNFIDKAVNIELGRVVDSDSVYINGTFVGTTGYQYPPRRYTIPAGTLRSGKNIITIRVINESGLGGFVPDKPYEITSGKDSISLAGNWKFKFGAIMPPLPPPTFVRWQPTGLFNGKIAPLLKAKLKGVIWYQGESDVGNPMEYAALMETLIADWREHFQAPELPFLYVQLANYLVPPIRPFHSNWALLREAQLQTLEVPNTGMAVAIDVGEWNDIHPLDKKTLGERLALVARKVAYNDDITHMGPIYDAMTIDRDKVILSFTHTGSGLMAKGEALKHFAIAGENGVFYWAKARVEGDKVIVWSADVQSPAAVRYGWADNPDGANLYNMEGLPASPFRTDNFEFHPLVIPR